MRWQLASTFALTAMSAACYGPNRIACEKDGVATGVLCPADLECTGNTGAGDVLCAEQGDLDACTPTTEEPDRERTPCSSAPTANGLCIANVCTTCAMFPDDFECRYAGWTPMASPAEKLSAVWVDASDDAYAVGAGDGVILHYDGSAWTTVATVPGASLQGVWSKSGDVFAITFDGLVYRNLSTTPIAPSAPRGLRGIWGTSLADVIAVGVEHVVGRWSGTSWMWSTPSGFPFPVYEGVGGAGDAIIAVGTGEVAVLTGTTFVPLAALPNGHANDFLASVWGTSRDDFYVVGQVGSTETGVIHHYVNGAWAEPVTTTRRLFSIWGSGSTAYAVGRGGIVATLANGGWSEQTIGAQPELRSISGSGGDAIAVSAEGQIWRISPP